MKYNFGERFRIEIASSLRAESQTETSGKAAFGMIIFRQVVLDHCWLLWIGL